MRIGVYRLFLIEGVKHWKKRINKERHFKFWFYEHTLSFRKKVMKKAQDWVDLLIKLKMITLIGRKL